MIEYELLMIDKTKIEMIRFFFSNQSTITSNLLIGTINWHQRAEKKFMSKNNFSWKFLRTILASTRIIWALGKMFGLQFEHVCFLLLTANAINLPLDTIITKVRYDIGSSTFQMAIRAILEMNKIIIKSKDEE